MCWNKQVSLVTFILAVAGSAYLYQRNLPNDRWIAVFAATIAMIQLAEYFMWSDLSCGKLNTVASAFALSILALEPLMNMVGGLYFSDTSNKKALTLMLVAYLVFIGVVYLTQVHRKQITLCGTSTCDIGTPTPSGFLSNKSCNLHWYFMDSFNGATGLIWMIFLLIPFLAMMPLSQGLILAGLGVGTFLLAKFSNTAALGSLWCWFAIGIIGYKIVAK